MNFVLHIANIILWCAIIFLICLAYRYLDRKLSK
jgi:hypothetical protein